MAAKIPDSESVPADPSEWVQRYGDVLFRYAITRVRRQDVAEDLVQETFLAGLTARKRFEHGSSEQTWLIGILRRKMVDYFRKKSRERASALEQPTDVGLCEDFDGRGHWSYAPERWPQHPAQALEDREFWTVLESCLSTLPPALRETFSLRELERLETGEVCNTLGITATNLGVRLYRARMLLRRCLEVNWFADSAR